MIEPIIEAERLANGSITIRFRSGEDPPEVLIQTPTEEAQKTLEPITWRIRKALRIPLRVRLSRLLLSLAEMVLLRMRFTSRRSLLLDRLIIWAGK